MRSLFASVVLLLAVACPSWLAAQNRIYIENQDVSAGATDVLIPVLLDTDSEQTGLSLSIKFDETKLNVKDLEKSSLTQDASWFNGQIKTGKLQWSIVMDLVEPDIDVTIPPGNGQVVANLVVDVLSTEEDSTLVEPMDGLNDPANPNEPAGGWRNIFSYNGNVVEPALQGGTITITSGGKWKPCDATGDGGLDLTDVINFLNYSFVGSASPECIGALDCDGSGALDLTDAVASLNYQFVNGVEPGGFPFECRTYTQKADGTGDPCAASAGCP